MGRFASVALVAVLALTGCAAALPARDQPSSVPESASAADTAPVAEMGVGEAPDPLDLVNLWRVTGAEGEGANTWLRIDGTDFQLWRDCGMTSGFWRTTGHLFEASTSSASAGCGATMDVAWLQSVASFGATAGGWELIDSTGNVVATLTIDGAPEPVESAADLYTQPPVITAATRESLRQPVPLPEGLVPATPADLIGLWVPVGYDGPAGPNVFFAQGGTWKNSDDCHGGIGSWSTDGSGAFLSTSGSMHAMNYCDSVPVTYAVEDARLVAIDGDVLQLLDIDGIELMQLERA
jgi:hypothetical protein